MENQAILPVSMMSYTTGTIQMVPGREGYEPANQKNQGDGNLFQNAATPQYTKPEKLNEVYDTTYNRNRRLTTSGASSIGSHVDLFA